MNVLLLPGLGNSGPEHWQTLWERKHPSFQRVEQKDWKNPERSEWVAALEKAIRRAGPETVLVGHSLGCLLIAHWAVQTHLSIKGALFVALPDPQAEQFPKQPCGFAPVPLKTLSFPSIIVLSHNDRYGPEAFVRNCATHWGSRVVDIGEVGHINADSGLGEWPAGQLLLCELGVTECCQK